MDFIKKQYWERGYEEVISPNIFNLDLWHTSGHAYVIRLPLCGTIMVWEGMGIDP